MIIGPDFVWLHFPKCAGTTLELALRDLLADRPGVQFDEIDEETGHWHHSIAERQAEDPTFDVSGKKVFCCIRRLPSWLLSRTMFELSRNEFLVPSRYMLAEGKFFAGVGNAVNQADEYVELYRDDVHKWLRTEHLASDVSRAFSLDLAAVKAALTKHRTRITPPYVKRVEFWFTDEDLEHLYEANPLWAEVERKVYGTTAPTALRQSLVTMRG